MEKGRNTGVLPVKMFCFGFTKKISFNGGRLFSFIVERNLMNYENIFMNIRYLPLFHPVNDDFHKN